jgi:hypothetical protein
MAAVDLEGMNLKAVNWQAVNLEEVNLKAVNLEELDREACAMEDRKSIHWFSRNWENVENCIQQGQLKAGESSWERGTVDPAMMQYAVYAVLGGCCTQCMLHSVSTQDHELE